MFRRSPFICEFVRYGTVLNPVLLVSSDKKNCQKHFKFLKRLWKKIFCCLPNVILQLWILPAFVETGLKSLEWNLKKSRKKS